MFRRPLLVGLVSLVLTGTAAAAPGDLDTTFSGDGRATVDYTGNDGAEAVVVQPDGKIVLVGYGNPNKDVAITRFNADGSPDASFDGDGTVGIDFGATDGAEAVALQPDGKIVVVGYTWIVPPGVASDVAVVRLNTDGSLDTTFSGDGKTTVDYGAGDWGSAVLVQPDGKIVLAGYGNANVDVAITRLNSDGTPDPTFDGDGTIGINFGGNDIGEAIALQADGKLVVAGYTFVPPGGERTLVALRLNTNGSLDPDFSADGKLTIDYPGNSKAGAVLVQPDGKIVLAGQGNNDFAVARLNPDGSFDPSFDTDGTAAIDFGFTGDQGEAVTLQPNGKLVVAGWAGSGSRDFAVARVNADGSLDTGFDFDARKLVDFAGTDDAALGIALQTDGRVVVAGFAGSDVAVARIEGDPPPPPPVPPPPAPPPAPTGPPAGGPKCAGVRATIVGTRGPDVIRGTSGADVIAGLAGDDLIRGLAGDDLICGGPGADRLFGGRGRDALRGSLGADRLFGGPGLDLLLGGPGADAEQQ